MPMVIECACGKKLKVRDELACKKGKCPGCGQAVLAPTPTPIVVEPVAEEVMAGEPPIVASAVGKGDAGSTDVTAEPVWEAKKKSKSGSKREEGDEGDV